MDLGRRRSTELVLQLWRRPLTVPLIILSFPSGGKLLKGLFTPTSGQSPFPYLCVNRFPFAQVYLRRIRPLPYVYTVSLIVFSRWSRHTQFSSPKDILHSQYIRPYLLRLSGKTYPPFRVYLCVRLSCERLVLVSSIT